MNIAARHKGVIFVTTLVLWLFSTASIAHETGYATLEIGLNPEGTPELAVEIDLLDLELAVGIDTNLDGSLLWHEYQENRNAIETYISSSLNISTGKAECGLRPHRTAGGIRDTEKISVVTVFYLECPTPFEAFTIDHQLLTDIDSSSTLLLKINSSGASKTELINPGISTIEITDGGLIASNSSFVKQGIHHIFVGYDHLAFLLLLLLPAARRGDYFPRFIAISGIVTAFTLAHSVTLMLSATGYINLPSSLVEIAIAASIVFAAFINIYQPAHRISWIIAYSFGLIHGFGFAGALANLEIAEDLRLLNLAAFNIGVELGQIVMVALALPVLCFLGSRAFYFRYLVRFISLMTAGLGCYWVLERI